MQGAGSRKRLPKFLIFLHILQYSTRGACTKIFKKILAWPVFKNTHYQKTQVKTPLCDKLMILRVMSRRGFFDTFTKESWGQRLKHT